MTNQSRIEQVFTIVSSKIGSKMGRVTTKGFLPIHPPPV